MKVMVTGGAGYVGSILCRRLVADGHSVTVLDNLTYGKRGWEYLTKFAQERNVDCELIQEDVRDFYFTERYDAVFHLAGLSNDPTAEYNPELNNALNNVTSVRLAQSAKYAGVERFIFASSCSVYDGSGNALFDTVCTEHCKVHPSSAYPKSKYEAEKNIMALCGLDFHPTILRFGTVYGYSPRMRYDLVVNTMVKDALQKKVITLYGGGENWRPLVHVQDAASAYIHVLNAPVHKVQGQVINVVYKNMRISEVALQVRETLRQMGHETDVKADYAQPVRRDYRASNSWARECIPDFVPKMSIQDAVVEMVKRIEMEKLNNFDHPIYYNIEWMKTLGDLQDVLNRTKNIKGNTNPFVTYPYIDIPVYIPTASGSTHTNAIIDKYKGT